MCNVEIHDEDFIFSHNFKSTKQGHESKRTKTKTFVFVEALKRAVWNVLTMNCFLDFFFGGVYVAFEFIEGLQCTLLSAVAKTRLFRRTSSNASSCSWNVSSMSIGLCILC